jgi:hypothetical protein
MNISFIETHMEFKPSIHTKDYLIHHPKVAVSLAKTSTEFALSMLAQDHEILQVTDNSGWAVAHMLAKCQPAWTNSKAAIHHQILKIPDKNGWTVAHWLAVYQPDWCYSEPARDLHILLLKNTFGCSVAHFLANHQHAWVRTYKVSSPELLMQKDGYGRSLAYILIENEYCLQHDVFFHKDILTLEFNNRTLADEILSRYSLAHGLSPAEMAIRLIAQGVAFKPSTPLALDEAQYIFTRIMTMIATQQQSDMVFHLALALYSTVKHASHSCIGINTMFKYEWHGLALTIENITTELYIKNRIKLRSPRVVTQCPFATSLLMKIEKRKKQRFAKIKKNIWDRIKSLSRTLG